MKKFLMLCLVLISVASCKPDEQKEDKKVTVQKQQEDMYYGNIDTSRWKVDPEKEKRVREKMGF